jgi:hypothetical protein
MTEREKEIQKMVDSGELSVLTECAYGKAVADSEQKNTLNKDEVK